MENPSTRCYYCGVESVENKFRYYDKKMKTQPRYQCSNCGKLFTSGSHGRVQGVAYVKERNVDPPELRDLPRECRSCGVASETRFKFYNNKDTAQPSFLCLACGQRFQMRLVIGTSGERSLVHTFRKPANRDGNRDLGPAPNSNSEPQSDDGHDVSVQTPGVPSMPVLEEGEHVPALSAKEARLLDLIEAGYSGENGTLSPTTLLRLQEWAAKRPRKRPRETVAEPSGAASLSDDFAMIP